MGAILYDLGRQPRAAHDFFVKYQDRILFGKDAYAADGVSVLLARPRDEGRVLRLLPRLPRVLEAIWDGPARRRAPEGVPPERAPRDAGPAAEWLAAVGHCLEDTRRRKCVSSVNDPRPRAYAWRQMRRAALADERGGARFRRRPFQHARHEVPLPTQLRARDVEQHVAAALAVEELQVRQERPQQRRCARGWRGPRTAAAS